MERPFQGCLDVFFSCSGGRRQGLSPESDAGLPAISRGRILVLQCARRTISGRLACFHSGGTDNPTAFLLMNNHLSFLPVTFSAPAEVGCATFRIGTCRTLDLSRCFLPRANGSPATSDGETVEKFTGGHTRVVWVTDAQNKDSFAERNELQLVGYDSRDGKGERIICAERANYYRPLITPDGQRIVFSNRQTRKIYVVKWDGSHPRLLKEPGCATEVWRDPRTRERPGSTIRKVSKTLRSPYVVFRLMSLTRWKPSGPRPSFRPLPSFQLSRDGKMAASTFPWPSSGVAELPNVALAQASRRLLAFDGARRQLHFVDLRWPASKLDPDKGRGGGILDDQYIQGSGRE